MSRTVIVRYRTRPETADENARLVEAVYASLAEVAPADFRYATYLLEDGVTFLHVAHGDGPNPLPGLAEFQEFQHGLADRCAEPPSPSQATVVGSYDSERHPK